MSWELRLLAKNHGVNICIGITEAEKNVLFPKTEKNVASSYGITLYTHSHMMEDYLLL